MRRSISTRPLRRAAAAAALAIAALLSPADAEEPTEVEPAEAADDERGRVDAWHRAIEAGLRRTAVWADSFFADERYEAETNESRLRLRVDTFIEEGEGTGGDAAVSLRLHLPATSERLSLFAEGKADDSNTIQDTAKDDIRQEFRGTNERNVALGLKYDFVSSPTRSVIGQTGLKFRDIDPALGVGGRYRELIGVGLWAVRFTEQMLWFTDNGFELVSTVDFDRVVFEGWLFRNTLEGSWFEEESGIFYDVDFSLVQPLSANSAVEYQLNNQFQTVPSHRLEETTLRWRYRRRTSREWLTIEVAPQLSFPRERDFELTPGILFRFDTTFGE